MSLMVILHRPYGFSVCEFSPGIFELFISGSNSFPSSFIASLSSIRTTNAGSQNSLHDLVLTCSKVVFMDPSREEFQGADAQSIRRFFLHLLRQLTALTRFPPTHRPLDRCIDSSLDSTPARGSREAAITNRDCFPSIGRVLCSSLYSRPSLSLGECLFPPKTYSAKVFCGNAEIGASDC
jgi:hypothetical protein